MIAKLMAKIGLDASEFSSGVKGVQTETQSLSEAFSGLGKYVAGAFSIATVTAFVREIKSAADEVYRAKQEADATGEGYQALRNSMRDAGQSADGLSGFLNKLYSASLDAQSGNTKLVGAFDALGISVEDLRSMKTDEIFGAIGEAIVNASDQTEAYGAVMDIFGQRMTAKVLPALQDVGSEGFDELTKRMKDSGRVMSDEFLDKVNRLETRIDTFKQKMVGLVADFTDGWDTMIDYIAQFITSGGDATKALDDMANAQEAEAEAARLAEEAHKRRMKAMQDAVDAAAAAAKEEADLADAQDHLDKAMEKVTQRQFDALPTVTKLATVTAELKQAEEDLAEAEAAAEENRNSATVEAYAKALDRYNGILEDQRKIQADLDKEKQHAEKTAEAEAKAVQKEAEAVDKARQKYYELAQEQALAKKSTQEQAEWHQETAKQLRAEAEMLEDGERNWKMMTAALQEDAKAQNLLAQAQEETNQKLEKAAETVQSLSEYVKGLSEKDFQKLVASLRDLGEIAKEYDFSGFAGLESLQGFKLPSLTRSQTQQFITSFQKLAEGLRDIEIDVPAGLEKLNFSLSSSLTNSKAKSFVSAFQTLAKGLDGLTIDVPDGLEKLSAFAFPNMTSGQARQFGRALKTLAQAIKDADLDLATLNGLTGLFDAMGTAGRAEIQIAAPPKEDLVLTVEDDFKKDLSSLAKSAATLAKLKGVIYA